MLNAARHFRLRGRPVSCQPYGEGHINRTYLLITQEDAWYILQQINHRVFLDVPALMDNIGAVTRHLAHRDPCPRRVLTIVQTHEGQDFYHDQSSGAYWRVYDFVRGSLCLQRPETGQDFCRSGQAFGRFQRQLADFPVSSLHETIVDFHNTPVRFAQLHQAAQADILGRLRDVRAELAFALERERRAGHLQALQAAGRLPTRVTHNDTKLNNVLLDERTREALCVIDLDTVMPGLIAHDFGDAIRFGASTAAEDERDLDRVALSLELYSQFSRGFLEQVGNGLNPDELATLPEGAWAMTLECGIRFLADYLRGDAYFRTHREGQNLDRCRTQFKLVAQMERHWAQMQDIIHQMAERLPDRGDGSA